MDVVVIGVDEVDVPYGSISEESSFHIFVTKHMMMRTVYVSMHTE